MTQVNSDTILRWASQLVAFPSPQTALFEREPQVQAYLTGPVIDILEEAGLSWRRDDMGSIIVEIGPKTEGKNLMLMGYAMTHPANRMQDAYSSEVIGGGSRLRGRGLAEQKGALTAALLATAMAKDLDLKGRVTLVISSAGETGRHDAAKATMEAMDYRPDAAIICIGTTGKVALANKGRIDVEIKVHGKSAHSSTPWAGVDAIEGARKVLERVLSVDLGEAEHSGLGRPTLTATALRSWPEATHTLQDEVSLVFDRRLLPGEDDTAAFAAIAQAAEISGPWRVDTQKGPHMFPAEITTDGALFTAITAGAAAMGCAQPETFYSNGALDAGLFHTMGIEATMWGPGEQALWHADEESIALADIENGTLAYLGLIKEWCAR